MMISTHKIIAKNIIDNLDDDNKGFISDANFIWGNMKPDIVPKYKFKKHYIDESLNMVVFKINSLLSKKITVDISTNKLSEELGVICHFICDFFCVPHLERWEFKSTNNVKEHLIYENRLNRVAKKYDYDDHYDYEINIGEIKKYIMDMQKKYKTETGFVNDLQYSMEVCINIINMILSKIK